ncbi:hypothetical protein [Rhizobium leguminosarum]|uniref:hypothetical protein n=1 Tax=Rhizobium leguminosarum TaxID=384 RepID=UPI001AEB24F7|nr:hypothetical protein [Rhizobium leguminosarum]MBP2444538.1 Flp pilus assembly protein TadD [Rhizobium leguminosarum]
MFAHFFSGHLPAALEAGRQARQSNPYDPEVSAKVATVLYLSGNWDEGAALARAAARTEPVPRDANLVLALDAYRRGDYAEASLRAEQMPGKDFLPSVLRAAALGQMKSPEAYNSLAALHRDNPDSLDAFDERMRLRRVDPSITSSIQTGLVKAGMAR